jgi:hypothetical protein
VRAYLSSAEYAHAVATARDGRRFRLAAAP